jgi:P27 family predicted phage terminase small subunit
VARFSPAPPRDLAAPEAALWRRTITALRDLGMWQEHDIDAVERMVRASAIARAARERVAARLKRHGDAAAFFSKGSMGQLVEHPDLAIERRARMDADVLARELGLTPAARRRLRLDSPGDDIDKLLANADRLLAGL